MSRQFSNLLILLAALSTGACESAVDFSQWASGYNKAIERTHNENVFINMVRAAYNRPMHFSTISVVRGNGSVTSSITASLPFVDFLALARNGAELAPTLGVTGGFNFDMASLDTSEFISGLLTQISPTTINYYVAHGIPRELLFNLFIESLEITVNGKTQTYTNDPNTPQHMEFTDVLNNLLKIGFTIENVSVMSPVGPTLTSEEAKNPLRLQIIAQTGLMMRSLSAEPNANYQIAKQVNFSRFCFTGEGAFREALPKSALCGAAERQVKKAHQGIPAESTIKGLNESSINVVTRSTRDVFNYLGNLIYQQVAHPTSYRLALTSPEAKKYNYLNRGDDLFVVVKNQTRDSDLVRVDFDGDTYSIPAGDQGHSALVLGIVSQVLSLSKSINSIPASSAIVVR